MDNRGYSVMLLSILLLLAAFFNLSCGAQGNATAAERDELLQAVRRYWETGRDYSLGFTSGVGELGYAEVQGDEAEVEVEIIVGYTQPTDGAGYKETTFRLRRVAGSWEVIYDGWTDKELEASP
jgi:hypothetical protein